MREANEFVARLHRHHMPLKVGYKFSVAVSDGGSIRGVAIVGMPATQALNDGRTLEVRRVATDGCENACSALYGAAWRAARALGYTRLYTYTLPSEGGTSLRAAGFAFDGISRGQPWNTKKRKRADAHPLCDKSRWVKVTANRAVGAL